MCINILNENIIILHVTNTEQILTLSDMRPIFSDFVKRDISGVFNPFEPNYLQISLFSGGSLTFSSGPPLGGTPVSDRVKGKKERNS